MFFKHGSTTGLIFIIRTLFIIIPIFLNVASRAAVEVLQAGGLCGDRRMERVRDESEGTE